MFEPGGGRGEEFLSSEDLELATLSFDELMAVWDFWLAQAQSTNKMDAEEYSYGVFVSPHRARELLAERPSWEELEETKERGNRLPNGRALNRGIWAG